MLSLPGHGVFLSSLLKKERITAPEEIFVCSCSTNPEDFLHKGLFVCLARPEEKIISEVSMAVEHGAEVVIVRSGCQASVQENFPDALVLEAADPRVIYGKICQEFYGNPAGKLKLIAVTGTSGKTSLSYVIAGILAEAGYPVGLIGTLGVYDGQTLTPCSETTPNPERMAELLAKMVENECTHAIIEVSSVAIEKRWLSGLLFDAVCLTNIRRDHLDYHRTVDQYRRTKMQIFKYLKKDAIAICNLDDRVSDAVLHLIDCPTMTVGMYPTECMVSGMLVEQSISNQVFYIFAGTDAVPVHTHIIGNEHIYNCLLATALGISWDIDLKTVVRGIERVEHIPGRFEQIDCGQPFGVFVDNANTSESLMAVLKTIR
ncbi:MAG: hypothetical protein IKW74_01885, partial [Thermoguttaceae bacterium]|nr:hypothetical protein [Thermoguttaceae bacterium]